MSVSEVAHYTVATTSFANRRCLALWRCAKYMHEWVQLKELERFLRLLQESLTCKLSTILARLDRLMGKVSLLIIVCTASICIEPETGDINVDHIQCINVTGVNVQELVFFRHRVNDLLVGLKVLKDIIRTRSISPATSLNVFERLERM